MAPPAVFLALTWYFGWNALHGESGLLAQRQQIAALDVAKTKLAAADAARAAWETRVADLSDKSVAPDMLDSQARQVLNLADPRDLVVNIPDTQAK